MNIIWYLLKCAEESENDYAEKYRKLAKSDSDRLQEVICFEYQRMMRYGGGWHLERRKLLPGCIFLLGTGDVTHDSSNSFTLVPYEPLFIKSMCRKGNMVDLSKGFIKAGKPVVTSGPLKGREHLIRRIDRHRRTAEIEIPFAGNDIQITVGLEIYEKQM